MHYKLINSPSFNSDADEKRAVYSAYRFYFIEDHAARKKLAQELWQNIKTKKKNLVYTVDLVLLIICEDCLQKNELVLFLQLVSKDSQFLEVILNIIQDVPDLALPSFEMKDMTIDESKIQFLDSQVKSTKKKGIEIFQKWFYNDDKFFSLVLIYCPIILKKISDNSLKKLILNNFGAISLLNNKEFSRRLSLMMPLQVIIFLFSAKVPSHQKKEYTLALLKYCVDRADHGVILSTIFKSLSRFSFGNITFQDFQEIKSNLLSCERELLSFINQKTELFTALIEDVESLFAILEFSENSVKALEKLVKSSTQIADWVAENILVIVQKLIEGNSSKKIIDICAFLKSNSVSEKQGPKKSYLILLTKEMHEIFGKILKNQHGDHGARELSAVFTIIENFELRKIMGFTIQETLAWLKNPILKPLADLIVAQDNLHEMDGSSPNLTPYERNKPYMQYTVTQENVCLSVAIDAIRYDPRALTPISAYLVTSKDTAWLQVKDVVHVLAKTPNNTLHPIVAARVEFDKESPNLSFKNYLVDYLLSDQCFQTLLEIYQYIDLVLLLATSKQMIKFLLQANILIENPQNSKGSLTRSQIIPFVDHFLLKTFNNPVFSVKLAVATNRDTIFNIKEFLFYKEIVDYIDCQEMLYALLLAEEKGSRLIQKISSNVRLVKKLLRQTKQDPAYSKQLTSCLEKNKGIYLFSKFQQNDFSELIGNCSIDVIMFLFKNDSDSSIQTKFLEIVPDILFDIPDQDHIIYFLEQPDIVNKVVSKINFDTLVEILCRKIVCDSKKIVELLFDVYSRLPFQNFSNNQSILLTVIHKNPYFAEIIFSHLSFFLEFKLTPELLLTLLFQDKYTNTLMYLFANKAAEFLSAFLRGLLPIIPSKLQSKIGNYFQLVGKSHPEMPRAIVVRRINTFSSPTVETHDQLRVKHYNYEMLKTVSNSNVTYKNLIGMHAVTMTLIHLDLVIDFNSGMNKLIEKLNDPTLILSTQFIPFSFLLHEKYFLALLELIKTNADKVSCFIQSIPAGFEVLIQYFNVEKEGESFILARILVKLKRLMLSLLLHYSMVLQEKYNEETATHFLNLIFIYCANFPGSLNQLLQEKGFFYAVCSCLYVHKSSKIYKCKNNSEFIFRFMLLKIAMHDKELESWLSLILYELSLQEANLFNDNYYSILTLIPASVLDLCRNSVIINYFLRQPLYVSDLEKKQLIKIFTNLPELIHYAFIYPHIYGKLNNDDFVNLLTNSMPNKSSEEIRDQLTHSVFACLITEHPFFQVQENQEIIPDDLKTTTSQLFLKMEVNVNQPSKLIEPHGVPNIAVNQEFFVTLLLSNNYLPFGKDEVVNLLHKINTNPIVTKFELMLDLVALVAEPDPPKNIYQQINNIDLSNGNLFAKLIDANMTSWRQNFATEKLNSIIEAFMKIELTSITGFRKSSNDDFDALKVDLTHGII